MSSPIDAVVHDGTAYFRPYRSKKICSYNLTSGWLISADCLVRDCSLVVLPVPYGGTVHSLHTIGGNKRINHQQNDDEEEFTDAISQLTNYAPGEWTPSIYPPLTTKRSQVTVVLDNDYLIVAGGYSAYGIIQTVDVLYLGNEEVEWHEVASLPYKVFRASGCVCNGMLYILGGYVVRDGDIVPTRNACVATVSQLVKSHSDNRKIFKTIKKWNLKHLHACHFATMYWQLEVGNLTRRPVSKKERSLSTCITLVKMFGRSWKVICLDLDVWVLLLLLNTR